MDKNIPAVVSNGHYQRALEMVPRCFDIEVSRISQSETAKRILEFYIRNYEGLHWSQFFVGSVLKTTAEDIFTDAFVRDFVLDLTDRVSLEWSILNLDFEGDFLERIVTSIARTRIFRETSLINKETQQTIASSDTVMKILLKDNIWLVVYYLSLLYFHQTAVYDKVQKTANK